MNYNDDLLNKQEARTIEPTALKTNFPSGEAKPDRPDEVIYYLIDKRTGLAVGQADTFNNASLMRGPWDWIKRTVIDEVSRQEEGRRRRQGNRMGEFEARTNI